MAFFQKLDERVNKVDSLLCIGLDPHIGQLPQATAEAAFLFCKKIIEESHEFAAAYKPNIAFFECFGSEGMKVLKDVLDLIPKDIPIVLDCKRGDIDTTAAAYAMCCYDVLQADCVTLNAYMGFDSVKPFISNKYDNKAAFILCKTSNPSSNDFQTLQVAENETLFERMASITAHWNSVHGEKLGLVVGATDIPALSKIRRAHNRTWILCPGVGAQGGEPHLVCQAGLRSDGSGLLISVSRAISNPKNNVSIGQAAKDLRDAINQYRTNTVTAATPSEEHQRLQDYQREFIEFAINKQALKFGEFTLKSGRLSPYFFNAGCFSCGQSLGMLGRAYAKAIKEAKIEFDVVFGPAYKGIPLGTIFVSEFYRLYGENKDLAFNRKEVKDHGEGGLLVGASVANKRVLIIDDVITAGTAIRESFSLLAANNAVVVAVVVCLDRQELAGEGATLSAIQQIEAEHQVQVKSIIGLSDLVHFIQEKQRGGDSLIDLEKMENYRKQYGIKN